MRFGTRPGSTALVGYLYGGVAADAPNNGSTVASNLIFKLLLTPQ
jgi:hypothetical protein